MEVLTDEEKSSEDSVLQQKTTGTLVSPILEYSEWSCLRLVYQIIGSGSLKVLQRTEGKSFDKPLWSGQTPSDSWVIASMDLQNNTESYKVLFIFFFYLLFITLSFETSNIYNDLALWQVFVNISWQI